MILRPAIFIALLALATPTAPVLAQQFFVRGGPLVPAGSGAMDDASAGGHGYAGIGFWLSDLLQTQLAAGIDREVTAEARLVVRPFTGRNIEPYAYTGVGSQIGDEARRGSVPLGVGVMYEVQQNTALVLEVGGRWIHRLDPVEGINDLHFDLAPSVGVAYTIGRRPVPVAPGMIADAAPTAEPAEPAAAASAAPQRQGWMRPEVEDLGHRIRVPDGTFVMGLADEDPLRLQTAGLKRITVSGFEIDKYEVSNRAYREFLETLQGDDRAQMQPDPTAWDRARSTSTYESYFLGDTFADHPVVAVTWQQAIGYCESLGGRLPTEAEWEYAARSGEPGSIYPWQGFDTRGADGSFLANYRSGRGMYAADGYAFTAPVESFVQTPWGMANVAGNVAEWVMDGYAPTFDALTDFNPYREEAEDGRRVIRGGSWASDEFFIGVGVRDAQAEDEATIYTGFRCAYDVGAGPVEGSELDE